ncbi:MAG: CBS domain-containing protein, partial [Desulfomonile tiedjei]|nr:CBS domain-containing protein [Desulfomonile tiedjei]
MLVKYWMRKDFVTVDIDDSMQDALTLMKEHKVAMLPVMRKGELVGVVTDRDLKRASASDATTLDIHELIYLLSKIKIGEIMSKNPVTVPPDYTIEEAASVMLKHDISGAPVVDKEGRVLGLVTKQEMFKALISLSGLERRGVQFAFQLEDNPGSIKEVTDIIRNHGCRLVSILTSYERAPVGYRHVYVRAHSVDRLDVPKLLDE